MENLTPLEKGHNVLTIETNFFKENWTRSAVKMTKSL